MGRNFARKDVKEFEKFKIQNCLILKALLKVIHELTTRNCQSLLIDLTNDLEHFRCTLNICI